MGWEITSLTLMNEEGRKIEISNLENIIDLKEKLDDNLILSLLMVQNIMKYGPKPQLTVDGILILTPNDSNKIGIDIKEPSVVLIKRGHEPYKDMYAIPGGFVEFGETTEDAVIREFMEECGIITKVKSILGVYSDPERDPRWHTITIVYILEYDDGEIRSGDDAASVEIIPLTQIPEKMAFDHRKILEKFIEYYA